VETETVIASCRLNQTRVFSRHLSCEPQVAMEWMSSSQEGNGFDGLHPRVLKYDFHLTYQDFSSQVALPQRKSDC
jgi:hypothetical protein